MSSDVDNPKTAPRAFTTHLKLGFAISAGALLFVALGLALLQTRSLTHVLPRRQLLRQEFAFRPRNNACPADFEWDFFVNQQRFCLLNLARTNTPALAGMLSVETTAEPLRLSLSLRCSECLDVTADFSKLVADYVAHNANRIELVAANADHEDNQTDYQRLLLDRLEQLNNTADQQRDQFNELQTEYNRLAAELAAMKQQLNGSDPNNWPSAFETFVQAELDQTLAQDSVLAEMKHLLGNLYRMLAVLDDSAAHTQVASDLDPVLSKRDDVRRRCRTLQAQMRRRRTILTEPIKHQMWPQYQVDLRCQIDQTNQLIANNTADRDTISQTIRHSVDSIADVTAELRLLHSPKADTDLPPDPVPGENPQSSLSFTAFLDSDIPPHTSNIMLDWPHFLFLAATAAVGGLLGFILHLALTHHQGLTTPASFVDAQDRKPSHPAAHPAKTHLDRHLSNCDQAADVVAQLACDLGHCPVILLGATLPKDASARLAVGLAIAITRKKARALLVEANSDRSELTEIFDVPDAAGLSELIAGRTSIPQVVHQTRLPDLSFLPFGSAPPDDGLAKQAQSADSIWNDLRKTVDVILIYEPLAFSAKPGPHTRATASPLPADVDVLQPADAAFCLARSRFGARRRVRKAQAGFNGHQIRFLGSLTF